MSQNPHTTAKGFFHSKTADKIGDVMLWSSLAGYAVGATLYFTGGSDLVGTVCIISATVVGWLSRRISAKGRHEDAMLDRR